MRLLSRIAVPTAAARETFAEVDTWPLWMPGVERLEVLERSEQRLLIDVDLRQMGTHWRQTQEIRFTSDGLRQRQVAGKIRRWEAEWRFLEPPDGRGTTVSLGVDLDLGLLGVVIPNRFLQRSLEEGFEETLRRIQERAVTGGPVPTSPRSLLRLVRTLGGLEVEIGEGRYRLRRLR